MGCLAGFGTPFDNNPLNAYTKAGINLPKRKLLGSFKTPKGYTFLYMEKIKNFDYMYFIGMNELNRYDRILVILDTKTMKPKYETPITWFQEITYPKKDEMKISFPCANGKQGYDITLKLASDKITEVSKELNESTVEQKKTKKEVFAELGEELHRFDNGNILYLLNSEYKSVTDKYLTLKDKNLKEIKKVEVPGDDMTYDFSSSSDKYIAMIVDNKVTQSDSVDIYSIPDLNKVCSFPSPKLNNKRVLLTSSLFIENDKIILGFAGEINIGDIKTGKIEKSFMLEPNLACASQHKLADGTFISILSKGIVYHWKMDGTIISKSRGEACDSGLQCSLGNDKGVILSFKNIQGENRVNLESIDETQ